MIRLPFRHPHAPFAVHCGQHPVNDTAMKNILRKYQDLILFILLFIIILTVFFHRDRLFQGKDYVFSSVNAAYFGKEGRVYAIDRGKEVICIIAADNTVTQILYGGNARRFGYAEGITEGADGEIYISDSSFVSDEDGVTSTQYRIIEYREGRYRTLYNAGEDMIFDLQYLDDGSLHFLKSESYGLGYYILPKGSEPELKQRIYTGDVLNYASIDVSTGTVAVSVKRGSVRILKPDTGSWTTLKNRDEHLMPQGIVARNGYVWFTEHYGGKICRFSEDDPEDYRDVYSEPDLKIPFLSSSDDGSSVLGADLLSFYRVSIKSDGTVNASYEENDPYKGFYLTVILWILVAVGVLMALRLLRFLPGVLMDLLYNEASLRMTAVVFAVVMVSSFIAASILSQEYSRQNNEEISGMKLFSDLLLRSLDTESLYSIRSESDYMGSAYTVIRDGLDPVIENAWNEGKDYYYVLYRMEDDRLYYLLNYYDSVMCMEPYGRTENPYFERVLESGNSYALTSRDADGSWLYIFRPVYNKNGERTAILEVGTDLSYRNAERRGEIRDIILNVFCSSAVMMMLIIEALFIIGFFERKRREKAEKEEESIDRTHLVPLRNIIFFSYLSFALQDSFVTVLSGRLYNGELYIPESVAAALPLSSELLMMAVFAVIGGRMSEKLGSKKTFYCGLIIETAGFILCGVTGTYLGILFGSIFAGIGMGIINVTCNVIASMGEGMESTAAAFSDVNAGILSGLTVAAGITSLAYEFGGSTLVYSIAVVFMIPTLLLIRSSIDLKPESESRSEKEERIEKKEKIGFVRFFFNLRVFGFFFFVLVPFMTSISYREYFFPVFGQDHGINEVRVGQIFLVCGLLVIYAGPHISNMIIRRFGTFWSVLIASIFMGLNMLLFVLMPSIQTVIAGVVILSVLISFAYACQYTYFEQLPDSLMYGDGKSMGVYSVFENLGQTIGPMIYGSLLMLGYRTGIGLFAAVMLVFSVVYIIIMKRERKFFH